MLCEGASINPNFLQYIQACLSCHIFQGYGQTEALAANILKLLSCYDYETMGIPFPKTHVKLDSIESRQLWRTLTKRFKCN